VGVAWVMRRHHGGMRIACLFTGPVVNMLRTSALGGGTGGEMQRYRAAGLMAVVGGAAIGTLLLRVGLSAALLAAAAGVMAGMGAYVAHPASRRRPGKRDGAGRGGVTGG